MNRSSLAQKLVSTSRPALQGLLFGLLVGILLIGVDQVSMRFGLKESERMVDDILGGVIAGLAVFAYARARVRRLAEQLNTIALMNHHIRNALQVMRYAPYIQPESEQIAQVEDAMRRIDWALRDVLPGRITVHDEGWKKVPQAERGTGPSQTAKRVGR